MHELCGLPYRLDATMLRRIHDQLIETRDGGNRTRRRSKEVADQVGNMEAGMADPIRVVHYINQFFGGLGGEECWLSAETGQIVNRDFELISRAL